MSYLGDDGTEPAFMSDYIGKIINYLFDLDMVLTFITAIEINGRTEHRLSKIAVHYIGSWFFVDLLANFPFEVLDPLITGAS